MGPVEEEKGCQVSSHCFNSLTVSDISSVYPTGLSHLEDICSLPPGLEGRVQLLCYVSDLLGLPVNTEVVSQHM